MKEKKTSGYAITALIMGIFSLIIGWIPIIGWIFIILGITFGFLGLSATKDGKNSGKGMAIAGLIMSGIPLVLGVLLIGIGALGYFGTLNPTKFLPDRCTVSSEFMCEEYSFTKINSDSLNFDITLKNTLLNTINFNEDTILRIEQDSKIIEQSCEISKITNIKSNEKFTVSCKLNNLEYVPEIGGSYKISFSLPYSSENGISNTVTGEVFAKVN